MKRNMPKKRLRYTAVIMSIIMLTEVCFPTISFALTGGPSQPEVESFTPVGTSDMVDVFSGDFKYNIPLLDVDGYPINIAYQAGPTMDQEASWVGLGWNLNPGVINRNLRGLPDDANGDIIEKEIYQKPNWTVGVNGSANLKIFGVKLSKKIGLNASIGIKYNNYNGFGIDGNLDFRLQKNVDNPKTKTDTFTLKSYIDKKGKEIMTGAVKGAVNNMVNNIFPEFGILQSVYRKDYIAAAHTLSALNDNYSSRSFGYKTYTPEINMEFNNYDFKIGLSFGAASLGIFGSPSVGGYFSRQVLAKTNYNKPAYGYIYHWNKDKSDVLLDINREKDGSYYQGKPFLPIPISTYDLFNVSGQGVAGQIKPFRNAIDVYSDDDHTSSSASGGANLDFGVASDLHTEFHINGQVSESKSCRWTNDLSSCLEDKTNNVSDPLFEKTYFKTVGEKTPINSNLLQNKKENLNATISPKVQRDFMVINSPNSVRIKYPNVIAFSPSAPTNQAAEPQLINNYSNSNFISNKRAERNQLINYLTYENIKGFVKPELKSVATRSYINIPGEVIEQPNLNEFSIQSGVNDQSKVRKNHHIGEFTITQNTGTRYVYGIAAYNNYQREVVFNSPNIADPDLSKGQLVFTDEETQPQNILAKRPKLSQINSSSIQDIVKGTRTDQYYSSTKTPSYAHSFLLTSILSPDYFDILPEGPGAEDLGNYTNFDYVRTSSNYKWRTPYLQNTAQFIDGLRSETYDDKASYIEGEKEMWYLQTIKTKKHIAVFYIEPRKDGLDASDNKQPSYRLRRIALYDREQYEKSTSPEKYVEPIKNVWFKYDYTLCPGILNSQDIITTNGQTQTITPTAKLTLTEIYFTYGNSTKKFNSYKFNYQKKGEMGYEYSYNMANIDRWGNYKPSPSSGPYNNEFPYVNQNATDASANVAAWSLNQIKLPSGGIININYESDDYAMVQNKRAMQMMKIEGFGEEGIHTPSFSKFLYDDDNNINNVAYFKLPPASERGQLSARDYVNECLRDVSVICFKTFMNITPNRNEWVSGYAEVKDFGLAVNNNDNPDQYFYVVLKKKTLESLLDFNEDINPITKCGFTFVKDNLPHVVNPEFADMISDNNNIQAEEVFYKLLAVDNIVGSLMGVNKKLLERKYCKSVNLEKSWMRLNQPYKKKYGGGYRVSKIEMSDNWTKISTTATNEELDQKFGQEYDYTTTEKFTTYDGNVIERVISSGVASYEPAVGSEENPFRMPIDVTKANKYLPDEERMIDGPICENFYPSASVGYGKVTVRNLNKNITSSENPKLVKKHGVGKTVHEFYTANDFPTLVNYTDIQTSVVDPPLIDLIVFSYSLLRTGAVQGYSVELNDMHGKPKSEMVYSEPLSDKEPGGKLLSYTKYFYQTETGKQYQLNNEVTTIAKDGTIGTKTIAMENEIYADNRQNVDEFYSGALELNWTTLITCFGITFPTIIPDLDIKKNDFYSSTMVTIKNKYGILQKTEVFQDGATIYSENLAYDDATGELLVSKTSNEYKEFVYNTTFPAHWQYDGMGQGYKNVGVKLFRCTTQTPGDDKLICPSANNFLCDGDEVLIKQNANLSDDIKGIVNKVNSDYYIYKRNSSGVLVKFFNSSEFSIEVLRSGRRNMQNSSIFTASTLKTPLDMNANKISIGVDNQILDVKGTAYKQDRTVYKTFCETENRFDSIVTLNGYLNCINYILNNTNTLMGTTWSAGRTRETYSIPQNSINPPTNNFNTSFIQLFRNQNNYTNNDYSIEYTKEYVNGIYSYRFYIAFSIKSNSPECFFETLFIGPDLASDSDFFVHNKVNKIEVYSIINKRYSNSDCMTRFNGFGSIEFKNTTNGTLTQYNINTNTNNSNTSFHFDVPLCEKMQSSRSFVIDDHINNNHIDLVGIIPNWKQQSNYIFKEQRQYSLTANKKGIYKDYPSIAISSSNISRNGFFTSNDGTIISDKKWKQTEESTLFDPYNGTEVESRDALNRYRSIVYERNSNSFLGNYVAIGTNPQLYIENGRHSEATAFNFENEQELKTDKLTCYNDNHYFTKDVANEDILLSNTFSHTGNQSIKVKGNVVSETFVSQGYNIAPDVTFMKDAIIPFYPQLGKQIISGWIKSSKPFYDLSNNLSYCKVELLSNVTDDVIGNSIIVKPTGPVINGWQRFYAVFDIANQASPIAKQVFSLRLTLSSGGENEIAYFDDIRIQPYNANVKNYVYDKLKRVSAVLDENNYATFYQYDMKGELVSIKKETEKGIVTIKETRKTLSNINN